MVFFLSTVIILVLDQTSKRFLLAQDDLPWWLIDDHVGFDLAMNKGIAFSIPITGNLSIALSAGVILILLTYYRISMKKTAFSAVIMGMIIAGAIGNIIDRIRLGAVVDFIKVYSWPSFNVADAAIVTGFFLLIVFFQRLQLSSEKK